ncbi:MAG: helix-turn-helix transcriptional regulator [Anaerolineae bacterium]|nr:helix-turn-helix transcriptional regulator [Anaerolineae bacterium]
MSIVLTITQEDGQRWGLLPASFTAEELEPYRHVMEAFNIRELEMGVAVKFYSHCTKEMVLRFLENLSWLFDRFFVGPDQVTITSDLQRKLVAVFSSLLIHRSIDEQCLLAVLNDLKAAGDGEPVAQEINYQRLAAIVTSRRKAMDLTQAQVATSAQISRNYVGQIERAVADNVSVDVLVRLAGALKLPPGRLFGVLVQ